MAEITVIFNNQAILKQKLEKEVYVIGRQEGVEIHIDNIGISRNHARLLKGEPFYYLEDLNSANGTYVNGRRVQRHNLNNGDQIVIGKYLIQYQCSPAEQGGATPGETAETGGTTAIAANAPKEGDGLYTMAMDGEAIRKRMEELRQQKLGETGAISAAASAAAAVARAVTPNLEAELKARDAELLQLRTSLNLWRGVAILAGLAAAGLAAALFMAK